MSILNQLKSSIVGIVTAALVAALVVAVPAPLVAQQNATQQKPAAAKAAVQDEEENESTTPSKPGQEGIKVHGHWILDVKDKDGKIVEHRDFHNSLVAGNGGSLLISLLTGQSVPNTFAIYVQDGSGANAYYVYPARTSSVSSYFQQCNGGPPACNANLVTAYTADSGSNFTSLKLSGQFTPNQAVTLTSVATQLITCTPSNSTATTPVVVNVAPTACALLSTDVNSNATIKLNNFTSTTLPNPLSVAGGQSVSVSVTLSFS